MSELLGNQARFLLLAERALDVELAKTATSIIRYRPEQVIAVLDSEQAGATVSEVLGFGGDIPVVGSFPDALALSPPPNALLIGIAPVGGALPPEWRQLILEAIEDGLDIWSGLHVFLGDDPELAAAARRTGAPLHDVRRPPPDLPVSTGRAQEVDALRVLTVGTDCNVGKMTVCLELRRAMADRGARVGFAATGQTGIFLEGTGIAVDAVVADFVAGAAERLVLDHAQDVDVVLIEGQGSLLHPGYSGVTLSLLHGSMPQAMVLCHKPDRAHIYGGPYDWVKFPPLDEVVALYEEASSWVCPDVDGAVVAIACNTWGMGEREARRSVDEAEEVTGLPASDPIRFGAERLADAVLNARPD